MFDVRRSSVFDVRRSSVFITIHRSSFPFSSFDVRCSMFDVRRSSVFDVRRSSVFITIHRSSMLFIVIIHSLCPFPIILLIQPSESSCPLFAPLPALWNLFCCGSTGRELHFPETKKGTLRPLPNSQLLPHPASNTIIPNSKPKTVFKRPIPLSFPAPPLQLGLQQDFPGMLNLKQWQADIAVRPFNLKEASEYLGISEVTLRRWVKKGRLSSVFCSRIITTKFPLILVQKLSKLVTLTDRVTGE